MNLKTYQAYSMGEVLSRIRKDLGENAVVLHTRTFKRGGVFGIGARMIYEVTASDSRMVAGRSNAEGRKLARNQDSTSVTAGARDSRDPTRKAIEPVRSEVDGRIADQILEQVVRHQKTAGESVKSKGHPFRRQESFASKKRKSNDAEPHTADHLLASLAELGHYNTKESATAVKSRSASKPPAGNKNPLIHTISTEINKNQQSETIRELSNTKKISVSKRKESLPPRTKPIADVAKRFILDRATSKATVPTQRSSILRKRASSRETAFQELNSRINPAPESRVQHTAETRNRPNPTTDPRPTDHPLAREEENYKTLPRSSIDSEVRSELAALRELVSQVLIENKASRPEPNSTLKKAFDSGAGNEACDHAALTAHYAELIEHEVANELADEICARIQNEMSPEDLQDDAAVRQRVVDHLVQHIPVAEAAEVLPNRPATDGRPFTMALIGPTGVGKTTTVAKLAASFKLREGLQVGLITTDTYRIAAVEQLRTYANIIGVPLKVAITPAEVASACHALRDVDVVLIDTAGRSPNDTSRIAEIRSFIDAADPHETHLVLSSASSERVMLRTIEQFATVSAERLIFTKLDEAVNFGVIVNVMQNVGKKLSFITTGQEVPDQIERGEPRRLARLILGERLRNDIG